VTRPNLPPDEYSLRAYLANLKIRELRELAVDMRYRWEARRADLEERDLRVVPQKVRDHRDNR